MILDCFVFFVVVVVAALPGKCNALANEQILKNDIFRNRVIQIAFSIPYTCTRLKSNKAFFRRGYTSISSEPLWVATINQITGTFRIKILYRYKFEIRIELYLWLKAMDLIREHIYHIGNEFSSRMTYTIFTFLDHCTYSIITVFTGIVSRKNWFLCVLFFSLAFFL